MALCTSDEVSVEPGLAVNMVDSDGTTHTKHVTEKISFNCWLRTFLACGGAIMISAFTAIAEAQSAILISQLQKPGALLQITQDEATWIASLGISGSPLAAILCGPCIDLFGRKLVIKCFFLTFAMGFGIIAAATTVTHLYVGRIFCSIAGGLGAAGNVYMAETTTRRQRKYLLSIENDVFTGSIVITYAVSAILPWNLSSTLYSLLCLLIILYVCFTPESPHWLVKKGRIDCATADLKRLGHEDTYVAKEIKILRMKCQEEVKQRINWRTFLQPTIWKPFFILLAFHFLQAATGIYNLLFYTVDFVGKLGTKYDPFVVSIGMATARFFLIITVGRYFAVKVKRKTATAVSGFSMGVTLLVAAAYEYHYHGVPSSERLNEWIPILAIYLSFLVSCVGMIYIPWSMGSELFPLHVRGTMSGVAHFIGNVSMFVFVKSYGSFIETLTVAGTLLFYAVASVITGLFGVFILTETLNRSLHEIEVSYVKIPKAEALDIEEIRH